MGLGAVKLRFKVIKYLDNSKQSLGGVHCEGQLAPHQQSKPPLNPRPPTPSSTWGQGSGRHLCSGMQIFVKTYSRSDVD